MMKKMVVLLGVVVFLTAARFTVPQIAEGVITYEVKVNMHRTLPPEREEMKSMIPEFRTDRMQLFFNANESLYKPVEQEPEDDAFGDGHGMQIRMRVPMNETYTNTATGEKILVQEFAGKKFLIHDSLKVYPWKLGTESREINGYPCKMATFYNETRKQHITAWYTDKLRPFLGPDNFNTLPGTVLMVDINDGERVILAKSIEDRTLKKGELKPPTKGTKATEAEFRKFVEEQTERMRANGANVIIRN